MTDLLEERWNTLRGGYRVPYDPRTAIAKIGTSESDAAWAELWDQLHHQGVVDTASYAAVPELVAAYEKRVAPDWNVHALVGTIELQRGRGKNPELPAWLEPTYDQALARIAELASDDLNRTGDLIVARAALGILALAKYLRGYARILLELDESEVEEIIEERWGEA